MKHETYDEAPGWEGDFPGREKQDVFPAASMDGFTAARKIPFSTRRRSIEKLAVMNSAG